MPTRAPTPALLLCVTLFASGCLPRVTLPTPPPASAPVEQRTAALRDLEPLAISTSTSMSRHGAVTNHVDFMLLGNGQRVSNAADLLPVVDPESPTADYARRSEEGLTKASVAVAITGLMLVGGAATVLATIPALASSSSTGPHSLDLTPFIVGASLELGSLVPLILGVVWGSTTTLDRQSAFLTYPRDLHRRLGLEEPAPALAPPPPALMPPPAAPAL